MEIPILDLTPKRVKKKMYSPIVETRVGLYLKYFKFSWSGSGLEFQAREINYHSIDGCFNWAGFELEGKRSSSSFLI